jgi:hypothetical protein
MKKADLLAIFEGFIGHFLRKYLALEHKTIQTWENLKSKQINLVSSGLI